MRSIPFLILLVALPTRAQTFTEVSERFLEGPEATRIVYGASLIDVNRDGRVDLYQPSRLFLQRESGDFGDVMLAGRFSEQDGEEVFGAIFADVSGDGFPEMYVEDLGNGSRFFLNRFGIRWDVALDNGGIDMSELEAQGASWGDFDGDGDLDLFASEEHGGNRYFENLGVNGFQDSGQAIIQTHQHSYGLASYDYDLDGDLDVFVSACNSDADHSINALFRNEGDGTFADVSAEAGIDDDLPAWAVVWLDYDRDSWPDVYVVNMPVSGPSARPGINKLYRNLGDGTFEDVSDVSGTAGGSFDFGFGGSAADFDNDGWEDLYVANDNISNSDHRLLHNNGDGTFTDIMGDLDLPPSQATIAVAVADVNGDGWIDIVTAARTGNRIFLNDGGTNHSLTVRLQGAPGNRDGVGAKVWVYTDGVSQQREITAGDGMTSQNHDLSAHFGLGSVTSVDSVVVVWPGGAVSRAESVSVDRTLHLVRDVGPNDPPSSPLLLGPASDVSLDNEVTFSWAASTDPEADPISYTVAILSIDDRTSGGELVVAVGQSTEYTADLSGLSEGRYVWTVVADDGYWVRGATQEGTFVNGMATAVSPPSLTPHLAIYPNPSQTALTVLVREPGLLIVSDLLGREVARERVFGPREVIDVSGFSPGVYFVRLSAGSGPGVPMLVAR